VKLSRPNLKGPLFDYLKSNLHGTPQQWAKEGHNQIPQAVVPEAALRRLEEEKARIGQRTDYVARTVPTPAYPLTIQQMRQRVRNERNQLKAAQPRGFFDETMGKFTTNSSKTQERLNAARYALHQALRARRAGRTF